MLLLAACSSDDGGPPDVDWSVIPQNQSVLIKQAVGAADCQAMQTYFDATEDADVLDFLDWGMKRAGCYD